MKAVMVVVGTRPEIIKMALTVRALKKNRNPLTFVHHGQHYDYNMARMVVPKFVRVVSFYFLFGFVCVWRRGLTYNPLLRRGGSCRG